MKELQYKTFSLRMHQKNWRINRPNVCQFELTFGCGLHCRHCYTECYNKTRYIKNELKTKGVKYILGKIYSAGVVWLCFTGGDPLSREDFLDIYSYAKDKGFIITVFTNGYSMTKEIARYLKKRPPFVLEMTLNAVTKDLYEKISQVKGAFEKVMKGINLILKANLPLKIKTQVTKENLKELPQVEKFIKSLGLRFRPSVFLHARLNGSLIPTYLRISHRDVLNLDGRKPLLDTNCRISKSNYSQDSTNLFRCAAGSQDGIHIDPSGNIIPCVCIREPEVNLLEEDVKEGHKRILNWVRTKCISHDSKCITCSIKDSCYNCPGKALLEKRSLEEKVDWFCELANLQKNTLEK